MNVTSAFWIATGSGAVCVAIGLAMGLLVLWQSHRNTANILAALYNLTVVAWGCDLVSRYFYGTFLGPLPPVFAKVAPLPHALNTLLFIALVTHYAGVWAKIWAKLFLATTAALGCAVVALSVSHSFFAVYTFDSESGQMFFTFTPIGLAVGAVMMLMLPLGTAILYRHQSERSRDLLIGGVISTAGLVTRFIPALRPYPIGVIAAALTALLIAHAIIKDQLFNPLAETNRRLSELSTKLLAGETNLTALISNTTDLIWSVDRDIRVVAVNPAFTKRYGASYGAPLRPGMAILELIPPHDVADWRSFYERALAGEVVAFERAYGKPETRMVIDVMLSPIRSESSEVTGVAGFARDITQRKRAEEAMAAAKEAAETANRAKSTFLASMSHELRTPLNAILGYGEMLAEDAVQQGRTQEAADLTKIRDSATHLLTLLGGILDLSKIEAEKFELNISEFEVGALVTKVIEVVRPAALKNKNTLRLDVDADIGVMRGDATRVRQVLLNLLSNAAKFTSNGDIVLEVRRDGGGEERVAFIIHDTGIGLTPDEQERLFEPFVQANADVSRSYGGTGLGLALSRRLCQLMGGDIWMVSESGKGSTFTVSLPR